MKQSLKDNVTGIAVLPYCLIAVSFGLLFAGCGEEPSQENGSVKEKTQALAVRTLKATPRTFERRITVQGNLQAKAVAHVAARVAGNLDAIFVDEGDYVEARKTELFQIDPVTLQNEVTASEQQLSVAQASLAVAKAALGKSEAESAKVAMDVGRYQRLHDDGRVTDNEFELRQVQYAQAKAGLAVSKAQVALAESQVEQAAAALEISRKNLKDSKSIAPLSGVVTRRIKEPGEQVGIGEIVMRIEDPASLEAVAYLPASYYQDVSAGTTEARLAIGGKEVGTFIVTYRSPVIDTTLRTFEIRGKVGFKEAVAGAMAELTLVFERRQALGVPAHAVVIRNDCPSLFVAKEGKASLKQVETGLSHDGWTAVVTGLEEGETVVVEGQSQLREGLAITVLK